MYLLTLKHRKADGAYAVADKQGDRVLFLFEEEDDAERYGLMLGTCLLYTSPSPRDCKTSRMPSSA